MSLEQDASHVEQNVVDAVESSDNNTSSKLIDDVNKDLSKYGQSTRDYIESTLATDGLLPDVAMKTGLVSDSEWVTRDQLEEVSDREGNSSLQGMAARYLVEHYNSIGVGRGDINSDYVKGFDLRLDMAMDMARTMREFPGLLQIAKEAPGGDKDVSDGLTQNDIDTLLKTPDTLNEDQKDSLTYMKSWFDMMKTPRGIWSLTDWSTPRITNDSLDDFVDTSVPLGFRKQLEIVQQDYDQEQGFKLAAQAESSQPKEMEAPKVDDKAPVVNVDTTDGGEVPKTVAASQLEEPESKDTVPVIEEPSGKPVIAQVDSLPRLEMVDDNTDNSAGEGDAADLAEGDGAKTDLTDGDNNLAQADTSEVKKGDEPDTSGVLQGGEQDANNVRNVGEQETSSDLQDGKEPPKVLQEDPPKDQSDGQTFTNGDGSISNGQDGQKDLSKEGDNRIGPDSQVYQAQQKDLDDEPDAFGPNRKLYKEGEPEEEISRNDRFFDFGEEKEQAGEQGRESQERTEKEQEASFKTIKLKQNATIEDLARTQLPDDASDEQVKELSDKIKSLNDSLQAPGAGIEAGAEIRVPEDFEVGAAVDKTYIVESGDNLWNISKAHLKETTGARPSNKEILELVNKIVERNSIPNPDLIYPDQKIFIPGEAPEEVEPPEPPAPPEEEGSEERKKLIEEARESFGEDEPDKFDKFKEDMDRFEERAEHDGLTDEEVDNTYKEVRRLLEAEGDTPLNEAQREKLAQQVMFQAANPNKIDQGQHSTCNMNAVEVRTYTRDPSKAAKVVTDVATTGEFTGTGGINVKVDATPHGESKSETRYESRRSHASEIFQVTAVNLHLEMENRKTTPPGQLRYEEHDPVPGDPETEKVVDYSVDPPRVIDDHPRVYVSNVGKMRDVYASVTGKSETEIVLGHEKYVSDNSDAVKRVNSEESLNEYLAQAKADGKMPIILTVHTGNEPFWSDSGRGTAGGSGGGHIVTITDYQGGAEPKVTLDNSWGSRADHDARDPISVHDLYATMQRPRDAVELLKTDASEARAAGSPDHYKEFEIQRMERAIGRLNQEQFADKLIEAMDKAKADWDSGVGVDGKDRAMKKLTDLIISLPTDQETRVNEHKDSIGLT